MAARLDSATGAQTESSGTPLGVTLCALEVVPSSIRMSTIRTLAVEATDNGLLAPELAAGIRLREAPAVLLGCALRRT